MKGSADAIKTEVGKVIIGKDDVIETVLTAILAGGHILLEDIPGVGKTTMALAFSKAMGLDFNRVQFTPDVVPSDITGFTVYDKKKDSFEYRDGAVMCNFFLADEINRTSSKTQSALLEVMQEAKVTVDGETHKVPTPFVVMATQNPLGTAGTQPLPEAQLDRFMVNISMGYPDTEAQISILKDRAKSDPLDNVAQIVGGEDITNMQKVIDELYVDDKIYRYITLLCEATRENEYIKLGVSPRGAIAMCNMAKAAAFIAGRDYVIPEDIEKHFAAVCAHRLVLHPKANIANLNAKKLLEEILKNVTAPKL